MEYPLIKGLKFKKMDTAIPGPQADPAPHPSESEETQIAALLQCRFGDGMAYLPRHLTALVESATRYGFLDPDGLLTRRGRSLLARHQFA
jgi:hypothetical protein